MHGVSETKETALASQLFQKGPSTKEGPEETSGYASLAAATAFFRQKRKNLKKAWRGKKVGQKGDPNQKAFEMRCLGFMRF